ncbi:MAG: restriction endonuclease subunit S [Nitrosomonas sp.]|uniref:restriction endonuclease subunit S n=1 Tax=Nitrosomonas sp. TaxID=42353 RepID=UPI001D3FF86E|nr:restriction endonuclease subunit S [Nitrosomonas sp.]MBX9895801.1 restriction endonuclease subunit S [Nitrosomonas sp.]
MREQRKQALLPKLRFPEFREAGEWEEKLLGAVCDMQAGKFVSASEILDKPAKEHYPCFGGNGLRGYTKSFNQSGRYSLIGRQGALCGNVNLVEGNFYATEHAVVTTTKLGIRTDWLFYNLCLLNLNRFATGQAQPGLSIDVLEKVNCAVPKDEKEQQKIADCLSSIDELVTLETQKLDTLKTHKKGLMQQLFPAEGETLPKLRFPEFRDARKWEERELGPLTTKVGSGITPMGGDKNYKTKGRPFVRSQNVGWGELILNDVAFIDEETHQSFDSTEIKVSDVLLNITGASIGRSAVADSRIAGGNVNQHVCIIRVKQDKLSPTLLNHFLISERGQKQIDSFQAGGNRQGLNFAQIWSFVVPLPPTEHEQRRVADCLTSLDELITAQTQKLAALKAHKKGLMQQLFPSVGGVDGEAGRGGRPVVDGAQG